MKITNKALLVATLIFLAGIAIYGFWPSSGTAKQSASLSSATPKFSLHSFLSFLPGRGNAADTVGSSATASIPKPKSQDNLSPALSTVGATDQASGGIEVAGQMVNATVTVDGEPYNQQPNQIGVFPRVQIRPKQQVQVTLTYPQGMPGDAVVLQVNDGGHLSVNGKPAMSQVVSLDNQKRVQFQFQATEQLGIYRVSARNGADVKVVSLWADNRVASNQ